MGGNKYKQTKKARLAKDKNKKKDPSASLGDQVDEDPNQERDSGYCCLPVGKIILLSSLADLPILQVFLVQSRRFLCQRRPGTLMTV